VGYISIVACLVIFITAIKYHKILSKFSFAACIPIFIAICDFGYEIFHTSDHWYSITHLYVLEGAGCQLVGAFKPFWINMQTAYAIGCAVYLSLFFSGFNKSEPSFGRNNVYFHVCCWGVPLLLFIIGWSLGVYGQESAWCGITDPVADLFLVDLWMMFALVFLVACYSYVVWKLCQGIRDAESSTDSDDTAAVKKHTDKMWKVIRSIGIYPIAYFVQWFLYGLFKLQALPQSSFGLILVIVFVTNAGGLFNLFLYGPLLFNQIRRAKAKKMKRSMQLGACAPTVSALSAATSSSIMSPKSKVDSASADTQTSTSI